MLNRRAMIGGLAFGAAALSTSVEASAQAGPPSAAGKPTAADRLNALGPEADRLAQRIGLWDVVETVWASASARPVITRGLVAERVMYGSLLQELLRAREDDRQPAVARTDMLSFNRLEGRWGYVSFDTRAPVGLMPAWSSDAGNAEMISLSFAPFAVPGPGADAGGQLLRMEQIIRFTDATHDVKDQYFMLADGTATRWLAHRYAYARRE